MLFLGIAIFILLIACINYINLTTGRAGNRAREVGIRKVVGAYKQKLIKQFFDRINHTNISFLNHWIFYWPN